MRKDVRVREPSLLGINGPENVKEGGGSRSHVHSALGGGKKQKKRKFFGEGRIR